MSFTEGLSGLHAASENLSVLGKNIANAATVGYKSSSIDFTNVLASHLNSANSASGLQTGGAVLASNITQSFSQGAIMSNSTPLNAAINGQGMFVMYDPTLDQTSYTRNGQFIENTDGLLVNASGFQVLDVNSTPINLSTYQIHPLSVQTRQVDVAAFTAPLSPYGTITFGGLVYTNTDGKAIGTAMAPTVIPSTIGTPSTRETDDVTFDHGMSAGDAITVAGLTFKANKDLTSTQIARAFANLSAGATTGPRTADGTYTGRLSSNFSSSGVYSAAQINGGSGDIVYFTATSFGAQPSITASALQGGVAAIFSGLLAGDTAETIAARSAVSVANGGPANYALSSGMFTGKLGNFDTISVAGSTATSSSLLTTGTLGTSGPTTQIETLIFSALSAGDTYAAGGLTFTATGNVTASQLATAFYNKINSASSTSSYGTWSGTKTAGTGGSGLGTAVMNGTDAVNWSYAGDGVVSTRLISGVKTVSGASSSSTTDSTISIAGTNGATTAAAQIETLTFSALSAGDTYSAGGLTFAATSNVTAAQLAADFYNKINTASSTSIYGTWSGTKTAGTGGSGLGTAVMNGTTSVDWSYAGPGVVSTRLISGLKTTSGAPSTYLGAKLTTEQLANISAVLVNHKSFGPENAIDVFSSGFTSGSNSFVQTTTLGTDFAYLNTKAIDATGTIIGTYSDGSTYELGQIGVALIPSNVGLKALGNDSWIETAKSGVPVIAAANTLGRGTIVGSSVEASNVNQTTDMVGLLAAQQAYQASAQVVKIESQNYQTLIGMNG
jgi:flagellar hook protein FlgE